MKDLLVRYFGEEFSNISVRVDSDGTPYYKALDVCELLELKNTCCSVRGNPRIGYFGIDREDVMQFNGPKSPLYLTEAGVFKLILKCRKPVAYSIKVALSTEVLPQIMRNGTYNQPAPEAPKRQRSRRSQAEVAV